MRVPVELPLQANHRLGYTVPGNSPVNARTAFASGVAPLLKELMAEFAATGLPMPYIPKGEEM